MLPTARSMQKLLQFDEPYMIQCYAEVEFLQAEAKIKTSAVSMVQIKNIMKKGVKSSYADVH